MYIKAFFSLFSLSLVKNSPVPDAAPAAYASDYTQYFLAPEPAPQANQFHSQDDAGQYNFGYASSDQTKQEVKTADGVIRGAYSYVDANGLTQTVNYIADALGFRVSATNLPVHDVPQDVAVAEPAMAPKVDSYAYLPYAQSYGYQAPVQTVVPFGDSTGLDPITQGLDPITQGVAQDTPVVAAAPAIAPVVAQVAAHAAPVAPVVAVAPAASGSQYHAQDDAGQYSFGYNDPNSIKQEIKTLDGVVRGAYKYVDSDGILQTVEYIADDAGFRVAATNLPTASAAPVVDTPEVAAAKAAHYAAIEEDRSAQVGLVASAPIVAAAPVTYAQAVAPVVQSAPVATPVVQTAPVATPVVQAAPVSYVQAAPVATPVVKTAPVATPVVQAAPVSYVQAAPVATPVVQAAPVVAAVAPTPEGSQYHAQDDYGQYSFGYADGNSVKQEIKTADGVVRGAYSYIDADGIVQTVNYISDALGFRVGATNLPVHHVDEPVAAAAAPVPAPAAAPVAIAAAPVAVPTAPVVQAAPTPVTYTQSVMTPAVNYAYLPYATNYAYETSVAASAPVAVQAAPVSSSPVVATFPVAPVSGAPHDASNTQYHAQDDFGQFNYGYSNPLSTKQELKTADGVTRGSYSYVDANGIVQTVNYLSDAMGFKVAATNLPVGPAADPVVLDNTEPEVVDAYTAPVEEEVLTPSVQYAYLPYAQNYEYYGAAVPKVAVQATPVTYAQSAPVVQVAQTAPAVVPFGDSTGLDPITQGLDPVTQGVAIAASAPVAVAATAPVAVPAAAPVAVPAAAPVAVPAAAPVAVPVPQAAPVVVPAAAPVVAAAPEGSQYHAQDDFGQYSFGYSDGNSVKQEVKTADGVIRGAYSYVDSDGIVQTVNYIADALGFRVGATNLPVHHVDSQPAAPVAVAAAPVAVEAAPVAVEATPAVAATPVAQAYHPYASSYTYAAPAPVVAAAPAVSVPVQAPQVAVAAVAPAAVPVAATATDAANSQFHAQDDIGQFNYGYSNPLSTKQELKTADGVTRGSYSYVDANGIVQTVNYLSDAMGFRVAATNLPVHHVEDVPAAPEAPAAAPVMAPSVNYAYLPYATNYGYNLAAPAA